MPPPLTAGKNFVFDVTGSLTPIECYVSEPSMNRAMETLEAVTGCGRNYVAGFENSTVDLSGPWSKEIDDILAPLYGTEIAWRYFPGGSGSGKVRYSGTGLFTDYNIKGSASALVDWTAKLSVIGSVTRAVV